MTAESFNYPEHPAIAQPDVIQVMGQTVVAASFEKPPEEPMGQLSVPDAPAPQPKPPSSTNREPTPIVEPHTKAVNEFLAFADDKGKAELPTNDSQRHAFATSLHTYLSTTATARHEAEKEAWKSQPDKQLTPPAILPQQVKQHLTHYYLETKISSQNETLRLRLARTRQQYSLIVEELLPRSPELQQLLLINIGFKNGGPDQAVAYEATQDLIVAYGMTIRSFQNRMRQRAQDQSQPPRKFHVE